MPGDPYRDPVTGVLSSKLGLSAAAELEAAEREITHAAPILLHESPVSPSYDLPHLREILAYYLCRSVILAIPTASAGQPLRGQPSGWGLASRCMRSGLEIAA